MRFKKLAMGIMEQAAGEKLDEYSSDAKILQGIILQSETIMIFRDLGQIDRKHTQAFFGYDSSRACESARARVLALKNQCFQAGHYNDLHSGNVFFNT
jgi:hypothetical protein